jgi:hypothetical protein
MEEVLSGNLDVRKGLGQILALVKGESLAVVVQRAEERGMRSQMEPWDLHLKSIISIYT